MEDRKERLKNSEEKLERNKEYFENLLKEKEKIKENIFLGESNFQRYENEINEKEIEKKELEKDIEVKKR